jgi:hypothetical protein
VSIWDVPLDKLQSSRLLALRMHVARYVVSTGATQRTATVLLDDETRVTHGETLLELLEAAGAHAPNVAILTAALPKADILLIGESGRSAVELAERWPGRVTSGGSDVWAIDVDWLAGARDARIVESVEALIRIVIPEALGANGTPPDEVVAIRLSSRAPARDQLHRRS